MPSSDLLFLQGAVEASPRRDYLGLSNAHYGPHRDAGWGTRPTSGEFMEV
jgi:hypothetical protein